jgi:sigma-B regulation protein RsbU (phosphoserine phosphatase)
MTEKRQILLVGSSQSNHTLADQLQQAGYAVVVAADGHHTLELAGSSDLVLLATDTPGLDGLELLQQLKQHNTLRQLPIIVVTTNDSTGDADPYIAAGADDYLTHATSATLVQARLNIWLTRPPQLVEPTSTLEHMELLKYERELQIGRQIQADFLPGTLPETPGWEIAARFQPAREVAGDFYDAFTLTQNRRVGLVVADVCDKGVGSALFMALFRSLIRAFAQQRHTMSWTDLLEDDTSAQSSSDARSQRQAMTLIGANALKNAVEMTNRYMTENHRKSRLYATLFFGVLDPGSGMLIYINGGHNPPVLVNGSQVKEQLEPTGPVVGIFPNAEFGIQQVKLEPGDVLFCYTDGVPDAKDACWILSRSLWFRRRHCWNRSRGRSISISPAPRSLTTSPCWRCGANRRPTASQLQNRQERDERKNTQMYSISCNGEMPCSKKGGATVVLSWRWLSFF